MNIKCMTVQAPYGAFELKRSYQKNMLIGTIISGGLPLLILAVFLIIGYIHSLGAEAIPVAPQSETIKIRVAPPPPIDVRVVRTEKNIKTKTEMPKLVIPNPVPDTQVIDMTVIPTSLQIKELPTALSDGDVDGLIGDGVDYGGMFTGDAGDDPTIFIPYDEQPVLLSAPLPAYPALAKAAGVEGIVWINVKVGRDGKICDVRTISCSNEGLGFEEAAIAAAWKRVYRPAMQNDQPVAVWISVRVRFEVRK